APAADVDDLAAGDLLRAGHGGCDRIADVDEVAGLRAIAIDDDGFSGQGVTDEARNDQTVVLARTIGVEDAKRRRSQSVLRMFGGQIKFPESLGNAVVRDRRDDKRLVERAAVGMAIDGG